MDQLMAHLNDEKFPIQLVRYHNSQARNGLRDLDVYIQMLIARFDNAKSVRRRVTPNEIEVIKTVVDNVLQHFLIAEDVVNDIAAHHHENMVNATISETEDMVPWESGTTPILKKRQQGS